MPRSSAVTDRLLPQSLFPFLLPAILVSSAHHHGREAGDTCAYSIGAGNRH
jgi:hypothetical protein